MIRLPHELLPLPDGITVVAGIDTDIGKSVVTAGIYGRHIREGASIITHKMVQTGCREISEDIELHRKTAGVGLLEEDLTGETCPWLFEKPASPHFAAALEGRRVEAAPILESLERLSRRYRHVLTEGAGGLMVPLNDELLLIDLVAQLGAPVILVTSPRLGSLNHTLLSLEALRARKIPLHALVYNRYGGGDPEIEQNSLEYLQTYLKKEFPSSLIADSAILPSF